MSELKIKDLIEILDINSRLFIKDQNFINIPIKTEEKEAVLVDYINFVVGKCYVDLGMYTEDLKKEVDQTETRFKVVSKQEQEKFINFLTQNEEDYLKCARASVIRNRHMNETNGELSMSQEEIGAVIISYLDFLFWREEVK